MKKFEALELFRHMSRRCTDFGLGNSAALASQIAEKIELIPEVDYALVFNGAQEQVRAEAPAEPVADTTEPTEPTEPASDTGAAAETSTNAETPEG